MAAATEALINAATTLGRQEYRVMGAGKEVIVVPGLTPDGLVDLDELRTTLRNVDS